MTADTARAYFPRGPKGFGGSIGSRSSAIGKLFGLPAVLLGWGCSPMLNVPEGRPLSFATSLPLLTNLALLLGLSLFFGLAFEEFQAQQGRSQPGGVRTFPLLALAGAMLYLLDAAHLIPVSVGVLVLGVWLYAYYRSAVAEHDAEGVPNVGLTVPVCNLLAYLLGPITLTQPHWVAVGLTVTAVLLLTGRERLHTMARQLELPEIVTAGKFLILTGIILPNEPITPLTIVTPYQAWLALVAVCTLSYGSYLLQRYWASNRSAFVTAILGGLYSSTATTVMLARRLSFWHGSASSDCRQNLRSGPPTGSAPPRPPPTSRSSRAVNPTR